MKKKIIFVTLHMPLGGVERSLLDAFSVIPMDQYEVTLLLRDREGAFLAEIPPSVKVVELPLRPIDRYEAQHGRVPALRHSLLTGHWLHAAWMLGLRLQWVLGGRRGDYDAKVIEAVLARIPSCLTETYDVAIAYFGDDLWPVCILRSYLSARKRYSWSHFEHPDYQMSAWLYKHYYGTFDGRFACSEATAARINSALKVPSAVRYFPYVLNVNRMKTLASQAPGLKRESVPSIVTVARLTRQKGIDIAVRVHKRLLQAGQPHHWYVIGEGEDEPAIRAEILRNQVGKSFTLLGGTSNPYPFFATCDLYVQPSRYEGYCITLAEARAFCKPIVCTDFAGAREQLRNEETGLIVPAEDEDALFASLSRLLRDAPLRSAFSTALQREQVDTQVQARQLWLNLLAS